MADRCSQPLQYAIEDVASIPMCLADPTCAACFADPTGAVCPYLGLDWALMYEIWGYYQSPESIGCVDFKNPQQECTYPGDGFYGTTSDYDYCLYVQGHPYKSGALPTFGWIAASFSAFAAVQAEMAAIVNMPTLMLSNPIDPVVPPAEQVTLCSALSDCTLAQFPPTATEIYFHDMLTEVGRANVIDAIRNWLTPRL